jgi:hypothetical protein
MAEAKPEDVPKGESERARKGAAAQGASRQAIAAARAAAAAAAAAAAWRRAALAAVAAAVRAQRLDLLYFYSKLAKGLKRV